MDKGPAAASPPRPCAPRSLCRDHRACERCANIRQARLADLAENLQTALGPLAWTTLQPTRAGRQALDAARRIWTRATAPEGTIWTIEQAPTSGRLHLNILHPVGLAHASPEYHHHIEQPIRDVRRVAAYIAKRGQMPAADAYPGRLTGRAGPLWQHLITARHLPLVQAATIQHTLDHYDQQRAAANPLHARRETDRATSLSRLSALRELIA